MNEFEWKFIGWKNSSFRSVIGGSFLCLTGLIFWWMYQNYYYINPFVPRESGLSGSNLYGRNMEGDLQSFFQLFLIEIGVCLLVLLPYSFHRRYWIRAFVLQGLFGFWLLLMVAGAMHSSGLYMINLVGVFGINFIISILLATSIYADWQNQDKYKNLWNYRFNKQNN